MNVLFPESDATKMKKKAEILKDKNSTDEDKVAALEELEFLVETIDNANDLHKVGGLVIVLHTLRTSQSANVRKQAAWVLATAAQNNPTFQEQFLDLRGLKILIDLLDDPDVEARRKVLYAISSVVKQNRRAMKEFVETYNGITKLTEAIFDPNTDLVFRLKAIFFLFSLVIAQEDHARAPRTQANNNLALQKSLKDVLREMGALPKLADLLEQEQVGWEAREKALLLIRELMNGNKENELFFKTPSDTNNNTTLAQRLDRIIGNSASSASVQQQQQEREEGLREEFLRLANEVKQQL
eukprot:GEZU01013125.1.p2 GENE.GEZU01013125.1~~GEZU01013125.1.p2  ORF type:complete len:298 (+),score=85.64 GEZU01013125.1:341-1234(+)